MLVFVSLQMINLVYFFIHGKETGGVLFNTQVLNQLMLPADAESALYKPWTLITYMFTHFGLMHILGNSVAKATITPITAPDAPTAGPSVAIRVCASTESCKFCAA